MKRSIKSVFVTFMLLATLFLVTACVDTSTPYDNNNADGYTVSVKFDANGGYFTTNTSVITDSFNIDGMQKNSNGNVELALLSPEDTIRGKGNYFTPTKPDCFLVGWYTERTEVGKDANGDPIYTYANKWDFENNTYEVNPSDTYASENPVLTLYAAWVPMYEIRFLSVEDGSEIGTYTYNPYEVDEVKVPHWDEETGAMQMYKFPVKPGYTFEVAYYDEAKTQIAEGTVTHTGVINEATGTAENTQMTMYVEMVEGEWFHIYTVEQFKANAKINGSYELFADLDFGAGTENEEAWPSSLMYGTFTGTIKGNGHTIKNVNLEQNNNSKINAGLFGTLGNTAQIDDLVFENVTFTITAGTRTPGATFGLLAGTISSDAVLANVKVLNSTILVDETAYFGTTDYAIGKFCGLGYNSDMDFSTITVQVLGEEGKLVILENGNEIVLEFK